MPVDLLDQFNWDLYFHCRTATAQYYNPVQNDVCITICIVCSSKPFLTHIHMTATICSVRWHKVANLQILVASWLACALLPEATSTPLGMGHAFQGVIFCGISINTPNIFACSLSGLSAGFLLLPCCASDQMQPCVINV